METFHWKVRPDMNVVSEPKVVTVKLGDGYEQRRAAGLNNQLSTYSVTIRVRKCEHPSLKAFLERHGGVRAFQWTPPYDWKPIRVVCRKWSASVGALAAAEAGTAATVTVCPAREDRAGSISPPSTVEMMLPPSA